MTAQYDDLELRVARIERRLGITAGPSPSPSPYPVQPRTGLRVGLNVNAYQVPVDTLLNIGVRLVRFPLWADAEPDGNRAAALAHYRRYIAELWSAQIEPLVVLDGRSWADNNYPLWADLPVHYIQMGNEWDIESPSSYTQSAADFSADLRWAREWFDYHRPAGTPPRYLIAGGCASGQEWMLEDVDLSPVDAIAVHPYGQRVDGWPYNSWGHGELRDLIWRYGRFGLPLWMTEMGVKDSELTQDEQAVYITRCIRICREEGLEAALWYCATTEMNDEYDLDEGPALDAFMEAALDNA